MSGDKRTLRQRDEALALSVVDGKPTHGKRLRRRRCNDCGLLYEAEELTASFDDEGRRDGWICDNCY